jgi:hypothetical protein
MSGDEEDLYGDDFAKDAPVVGAPSSAAVPTPPRLDVSPSETTTKVPISPNPALDGGFAPAPIDFASPAVARRAEVKPDELPEEAVESWKPPSRIPKVSAALVAALVVGALALLSPVLVSGWVGAAKVRLAEVEAVVLETDAPQVAVAAAADVGYCTPALKKILRRVLQSCGLLGGEGRGCRPLEAKNVAAVSGDDFNALFMPLADRAGILQFEIAESELNEASEALLDQIFSDQRGASYFFVVSRSSPEGGVAYNQELSQKRGESVLDHLRTTFNDPDLDKELGLLWLGEEFAQLDTGFCEWSRSGEEDQCTSKEINRSAFVAWIDCRL